MKPAAQWSGQWLCFKMIIERCSIPPNFITAYLDESCTQHNPENQPPEQSDDKNRRTPFRKGTHVEQRTEEDRKKSGFQQLDFPSVTIPILSGVHKGHINYPEN